jgi:transcriptional regulator of aromatic amino acid metabolism
MIAIYGASWANTRLITMNDKQEFTAAMALRMLELVATGQIDRIDAQIMSMLLEWPRPSMREIGRRLGVTHRTIIQKVSTLKSCL